MPNIPDEVLDDVDAALEEVTNGHGFGVGSFSPNRTTVFIKYACSCRQCTALARLRAARGGGMMPDFCACPFPPKCKASGKCWKGYPMGDRVMDAPKRIWIDLEASVADEITAYATPAQQARSCEAEYILAAEHDRLMAEKDVDLAEARRRRNEWKAKAEGYDAVRRALREKVGSPWPPHMSRLLWAGIAADEKKRADDAEAESALLRAEHDDWRSRAELAEAQIASLPPGTPNVLQKRLRELRGKRDE